MCLAPPWSRTMPIFFSVSSSSVSTLPKLLPCGRARTECNSRRTVSTLCDWTLLHTPCYPATCSARRPHHRFRSTAPSGPRSARALRSSSDKKSKRAFSCLRLELAELSVVLLLQQGLLRLGRTLSVRCVIRAVRLMCGEALRICRESTTTVSAHTCAPPNKAARLRLFIASSSCPGRR